MRTLKRTGLVLAAAVLLTASTCDGGEPEAQQQEAQSRQHAYEQLVANQPGESMNYSPTRETINFWIDTWDQEGKLSYVYLMAANGQIIGYHVLKGLPVSYCALLKPSYDFVNPEGDDNNELFRVPAPSSDGVYYSGGQCGQYYGVDATTDAYVEFSIGGSLNYLLFDEPLPVDAEPLGFTRVGEGGELVSVERGQPDDDEAVAEGDGG